MPSETAKILRDLMKKKAGHESNNNQIKHIPQDEFSHKHSLINNPESKKVVTFDDFLSKEFAVAYIKDDRMLQLKSAHIRLVQIPLLQMKEECQDKVFKIVLEDLFNFFHIAFLADLKMTRAKEGFERKLQARIFDAETQKQQGFGIPKIRRDEDGGMKEERIYD